MRYSGIVWAVKYLNREEVQIWDEYPYDLGPEKDNVEWIKRQVVEITEPSAT